jgi:rhomboid protease GluP
VQTVRPDEPAGDLPASPPAERALRPGAPVTSAIVAINVVVFVAQVVLSRSFEAISRIPPTESLLFGANYALATVGEGRVETLVTACFLHAGIMHIAFNMLVLWQAGPLVERAVGAARMAPMYLFAGIASSLLSTIVSWIKTFFGVPGGYSVGASGAIMGVLAAALVIGWRLQGWRGPLTQAMARWLGFNLLFGILVGFQGGNIDNAAHIGGAIAGALVAAMWRRGVVYSARATRIVLGACAAVVVASAVVVVVRDVTDYPYAGMLADARFREAQRSLDRGDCRGAYGALRAYERLAPREDEGALRLGAEVARSCGRPM